MDDDYDDNNNYYTRQWSLPGVDVSRIKPGTIKTAAVIGGGTMGSGIAMSMLNAGIHVVLLEVNQKVHVRNIGVSLTRLKRSG